MAGWSGMGGRGYKDDPPQGEGGLSPELIAFVVVIAFGIGILSTLMN